MTYVTQIDGAPGAGKTHTLREKLAKERRDGLGVYQFWWLNFSNSGREDVEQKLAELFAGSDEEPEDRARTFHGLALSLMIREGPIDPNDVSDQIMQQGAFGADDTDHYAEFCRSRGMTYDPNAADPRKLLSGEDNTDYVGNQLFAINDYLTQTCKPNDRNREAPADVPIDRDRVTHLLDAWDTYKHRHDPRLYEHGDYVNECHNRGLVPAVDVLLIDEFQDLAPLEYQLYKLWRDSGQLDRIYIAGDPNQSIYSFRGGTPYYFENTDTDDRINLKESFRCPKAVADVGCSVLDANSATDGRGFTGRTSGGHVEWTQWRGGYDVRDAAIQAAERYDAEPSALFLTRTNYQLRQLENDLRATGIPFEVLGSGSGIWSGDMQQYLAFLSNLQNDSPGYAWPNCRKVLETLTDGDRRREAVGQKLGRIVAPDELAPALEGLSDASEVLDAMQIRAWKRDVLGNALDAPTAMTPTEIQVGTVHTAKGLEAPAVYLFTTATDRTAKRYARDDTHAAEEHRTWYVGATRASEELHLINEYFDGPTAPPIKKIRQHGVVA